MVANSERERKHGGQDKIALDSFKDLLAKAQTFAGFLTDNVCDKKSLMSLHLAKFSIKSL